MHMNMNKEKRSKAMNKKTFAYVFILLLASSLFAIFASAFTTKGNESFETSKSMEFSTTSYESIESGISNDDLNELSFCETSIENVEIEKNASKVVEASNKLEKGVETPIVDVDLNQ